MSRFLKSFAADRSGATSIEYGMIAVLISIGILAPLAAMSDIVSRIFALIMNSL